MRLAACSVLRLLLALAAVVSGELVLPAAACAQHAQKRVLTLYTTRRDAQIVAVGDRVLQEILGPGLAGGVDYYSEYLDQGRFFDADYQTAFRDSLTLKYAQYRFDLVVAVGEVPLEFVARNQGDLFNQVPVVYFVSEPPSEPVPNSTGFVVPMTVGRSVEFARALQPDLQQVFVITSARGPFESRARADLSAFASQLKVTYLSGLPTPALEARLRTLPPRSMVLYVSVDRDGADQNFRPLDYLDRISAVANAPVYSWVDSALDHGIVGGSLKSQEAEFRAIGQTALRVLGGESAAAIPVSSPDLDVLQADWRQLRRWGISEARLPPGTVVHFREPSVWEQYRIIIVAVALGLIAQTALIAGLLLQRRRRQQAERQVLEKRAALESSYQRIRDLGGRLLTAQEAERARIARELHDDIGQQLVLLHLELQGLQRQISGVPRRTLAGAVQRMDDIQRATHDLSHRLHPAKLRLIGLIPALEGLQREFSQSGVQITVTRPPHAKSFDPDVTVCAFRVAQEAIKNAVTHGGARSVSIHLEDTPELFLRIEDDGDGFEVDDAWGRGLGLISMRERVEARGGTFTVQSRKHVGTRIDLHMPLGADVSAAV
jgi:signal transduction histidine kinase